MKRHARALRLNAHLAKAAWGELPQMKLKELEELTQKYSLSVALGDVQVLGSRVVCHPCWPPPLGSTQRVHRHSSPPGPRVLRPNVRPLGL